MVPSKAHAASRCLACLQGTEDGPKSVKVGPGAKNSIVGAAKLTKMCGISYIAGLCQDPCTRTSERLVSDLRI